MTIQPTQSTQSADASPEQAVLLALKKKGCNRGELSDLTGYAYSVLVPVLDILLTKGLIESYFHTQESLPVLTYRLRSPNLPLPKPQPVPPPPPFNPLLNQS